MKLIPSECQVTNEADISTEITMKQMGPNNMLHMKTADSVTDNREKCR